MKKRKIDVQNRRDEILAVLRSERRIVGCQELCDRFEVTRPIIITDIKYLRSQGLPIVSRHAGYFLREARPNSLKVTRVFKVRHSALDMERECEFVIRNGGEIIDEYIEHDLYGEIRMELNLKSEEDVEKMMQAYKGSNSRPLFELTDGYHYHTILTRSETTMDKIEELLKRTGYIVKPDSPKF